ncbi:9341_t:CDS:1 [Ambispora gerdemannii]|uniref:9341_t:CDS:1 n=1 Tax=Ambispora gerdemannii TaxID=144530 RepID=A0A9N9C815_9GLOM|nr:9341_t:CDS:1 [Ambispora gerdemannii]
MPQDNRINTQSEVDIKLNEIITTALLDTGARHTVISEKLAQKLKTPIDKTKTRTLRTAAIGGRMNTIGTIHHLKAIIEKEQYPIKINNVSVIKELDKQLIIERTEIINNGLIIDLKRNKIMT